MALLNDALKIESKKLEEMAKRDPLTGVKNRAGIRDNLFKQVQLVYFRDKPLSIIFIDLDHFKAVNDQYGHGQGDEILICFTRFVLAVTRQADSLVRWGGEEFLLVCPDTNMQQAGHLAEKVRVKLEQADWPKGIKVTASFGVTQMGQESTSEFIHRADQALYKAKSTGRNCVVCFEFSAGNLPSRNKKILI